jgi:hypothetical protein
MTRADRSGACGPSQWLTECRNGLRAACSGVSNPSATASAIELDPIPHLFNQFCAALLAELITLVHERLTGRAAKLR